MHSFSPTLIFCPHAEIAEAWHNIEYGLGAHPAWGRVVGWVGPTPEKDFFLKHQHPDLKREVPSRIVSEIADQGEAYDVYDRIMHRIDPDMKRLGHSVTEEQFRLLFIIEATENGLNASEERRNEFLNSVKNFIQCPDIQELKYPWHAAFIVIQDRQIVPEVQKLILEINDLLTTTNQFRKVPRCSSSDEDSDPPKVFFASTFDENGRTTRLSQLRYMAAALTHLLCEQSRWPNNLLKRKGWIDGEIYPTFFGLRTVFWEKVRAIDISRKKHFRQEFVSKWIDQGWKPVGSFPDLPVIGVSRPPDQDSKKEGSVVEFWGKLHTDWSRELWKNLQGFKEKEEERGSDLEIALSSKSIEDYRGKLQEGVFRQMDQASRRELEAARNKVNEPGSEQRAVRRILNIITRITDAGVTEKFKHLDRASSKANQDFIQDFEHFHSERVSSGTGLKLLADHYRRLAADLEAQVLEYSSDKRNKSFRTTDIMSHAMRAIVAQLERPHGKTLIASWFTIFGCLALGFFCLFELLQLADTFLTAAFAIGATGSIVFCVANASYNGSPGRLFSGTGWLFLIAAPLLGYGFYYALQNVEVGRLFFHLIAAFAAAISISQAIIGFHINSTTANYEKRRKEFAMQIRSMVEAMVNHRMVSVITDTMHNARKLLLERADELDEHIKIAKTKIDQLAEELGGHPEQPEDMEFISMLNPAANDLTRRSWDHQIAKDSKMWAEKFWDNEDAPRTLVRTEAWWGVQLKKYCDVNHRSYLISSRENGDDHQLEGSDDVGLRVWQDERDERFGKLPIQARVNRGQVVSMRAHDRSTQYLLFHPPGRIFDDENDGLNTFFTEELLRDGAQLETVSELYNPSLICALKLEHGYNWASLEQAKTSEDSS